MLQYSAVVPTTLELLKKLMQLKTLQNFYLVGETALALQLGHRMSIDLDLFTESDFETEKILQELRKNFKLQVILQKEKNSIIINIKNFKKSSEYIKIDIIKYPYPLIKEIRNINGIRLLSVEDIIPMKLSAIANRGAKKDFFDIYQLLQTYSLKNMLKLFKKKYPDIEHFHILKSLTYFEDAEDDFDPISLNNTNWEQVKAKVQKTVIENLKIIT